MRVKDVFVTGTSVGNVARDFQQSPIRMHLDRLNNLSAIASDKRYDAELRAKVGIDIEINELKGCLAKLRAEGNELAKHPATFAFILLGSGIFGNMTTQRAKEAASYAIETQCNWKTALAAAERDEEFTAL